MVVVVVIVLLVGGSNGVVLLCILYAPQLTLTHLMVKGKQELAS